MCPERQPVAKRSGYDLGIADTVRTLPVGAWLATRATRSGSVTGNGRISISTRALSADGRWNLDPEIALLTQRQLAGVHQVLNLTNTLIRSRVRAEVFRQCLPR